MRPTTKDLAKAAGVSLATVDRVLNGRSGVRKKTVDAVNEAVKKLGFERNQLAATLARKRGYRFGFVLPQDGDEFMAEILARINEIDDAGRAEMVGAQAIRLDLQDPHRAAAALAKLTTDSYDGIAIMAPETPQIRDSIRRMRERGIETIPFITNQPDESPDSFVGIDNRAAGATAAQLMGRFSGARHGKVAVVTDTMQARDNLERRLGFDAVINGYFAHLQALPSLETYADPARASRVIANILRAHADLAGIYIMGSEARPVLDALAGETAARGLVAIAHERTPSTVAALRDGRLDAVITQNPGHLVRSAVRILRARCENRPTLASQEKIRIEILMSANL